MVNNFYFFGKIHLKYIETSSFFHIMHIRIQLIYVMVHGV